MNVTVRSLNIALVIDDGGVRFLHVLDYQLFLFLEVEGEWAIAQGDNLLPVGVGQLLKAQGWRMT